MKPVHLARRFVRSLRPGGPGAGDEAWVRTVLTPAEVALWVRLSDPDRRHAVGVARAVPAELASAALRHDVGRVVSGFGTFERVGATLLGALGRDRWRGRVGDYLRHPELGSELLRAAGSDPVTVAWAREHHLPESQWSLPLPIATALKAAVDDFPSIARRTLTWDQGVEMARSVLRTAPSAFTRAGDWVESAPVCTRSQGAALGFFAGECPAVDFGELAGNNGVEKVKVVARVAEVRARQRGCCESVAQ